MPTSCLSLGSTSDAPELPQWRQRAQRVAEELTEEVVSDVLEPGNREGIEIEVVEGAPSTCFTTRVVMLR